MRSRRMWKRPPGWRPYLEPMSVQTTEVDIRHRVPPKSHWLRHRERSVLSQLDGGVSLRSQPAACRLNVGRLEWEAGRQSVADSEYRIDGPLRVNRCDGERRPFGKLVGDEFLDLIDGHMQLVLVSACAQHSQRCLFDATEFAIMAKMHQKGQLQLAQSN